MSISVLFHNCKPKLGNKLQKILAKSEGRGSRVLKMSVVFFFIFILVLGLKL